MSKPYSPDELEEIDSQYDADNANPVHIIAELINEEFHNGEPVRTRNSIYYVLKRLHDDGMSYDEFYEGKTWDYENLKWV